MSDVGLVAIEPLHDLTSSSVGELVAESERLGLRLVRRLADEWATGANRFDRPGEILFGAASTWRPPQIPAPRSECVMMRENPGLKSAGR